MLCLVTEKCGAVRDQWYFWVGRGYGWLYALFFSCWSCTLPLPGWGKERLEDFKLKKKKKDISEQSKDNRYTKPNNFHYTYPIKKEISVVVEIYFQEHFGAVLKCSLIVSFRLVSSYLCLHKHSAESFSFCQKETVHWNSPCRSCLKTKVMIVSYLQLNLLLMQSTLSIRRMNKVTDSGHIIQMRIWKLSTYSCILPHSTEY